MQYNINYLPETVRALILAFCYCIVEGFWNGDRSAVLKQSNVCCIFLIKAATVYMFNFAECLISLGLVLLLQLLFNNFV